MKTYEKIFINGKWQEASSNDYKEVTNTSTEEVIAKVKSSTEDDVDQAVQAAKNAFNEWNELKPEERAEYVQKILDGIKERQEEIAETITKELGSAKKFSKNTQAQISVREMEATLKDFKNYTFEEELNNTTVLKEGAGVVACITPWNYPLNQIQRKVTPALLAGNTVVVKPASETPLTAFIYAEIVEKAGLPAGVFNLVTGKGSIIGDYLAGHEDVAVISFTGSTEVGKGLYEKASTNVKKIVLELGGKSVMLYLEGGDLEAAIKQSAGTVIDNQGQTCSALSRLLVPKEKLEETEAFIKEYYKDIKVGNPADDDVRVGPMVSEDQYNTVLDYIKKGKEEGAEVLVGGNAIEGKGFFIEPTVFTNVTNDMTIAREEIFGPVLTVLTYDTVEEAIEIANDSPYGLSGAVVGPQEEAVAVARKLRTGNVTVNQGDRNPSAPFGGYKESGFGRENGTYAIEDYVELKAIFK